MGAGMVELGLMGRQRFVPTRFSSSATPEPGKRLSCAEVSGITSAGITGWSADLDVVVLKMC